MSQPWPGHLLQAFPLCLSVSHLVAQPHEPLSAKTLAVPASWPLLLLSLAPGILVLSSPWCVREAAFYLLTLKTQRLRFSSVKTSPDPSPLSRWS